MAGDTPKEPEDGERPERPKSSQDHTQAVDLVALEVSQLYGPRSRHQGEPADPPNRVDDNSTVSDGIHMEQTPPCAAVPGDKSADRTEQSTDQIADAPEPDGSTDTVATWRREDTYWANVAGVADRPTLTEFHLDDDVREHIIVGDLDRRSGGHKYGSGIPAKNTFPPTWDEQRIISAIEDVARNPDWPPYFQHHGTWYVEGWREGIHIVAVVKPNGSIRSGWPEEGEGVHKNDEYGNPVPLPWPEKE